MKKTGKWKWLAVLLTLFLLIPMAGCGENASPASSETSGSADDSNQRYAKLMGVQNFKETFKPRGKMTDQSGSTESTDGESAVSLLIRNVDGDANVFYYIDATGNVNLEDLGKEEYIPDFQKQLNENSETYHYSKMELVDRGANYYEFKVSIEDKVPAESLSAEEETVSEKKSSPKEETASGEKSAAKKDSSSKEEGASNKETDSKDSTSTKNNSSSKGKTTSGTDSDSKDETASEEAAGSEEASSGEGTEDVQVQKDTKPMVFFYVEKGKKTYEIIGLDMEAEDAASFSESFQGILDEIVTIKEVSSKEEAV